MRHLNHQRSKLRQFHEAPKKAKEWMASRLKLLNHPAETPQPRGRHHKNVAPLSNFTPMRLILLIFISLLSLAITCYSDEVIPAIEPPAFQFEISENPATVIAKGTWLGCDEPINTSIINADKKKKKISVTTSWIVVNQSPPKKSLALQHRDFEIVKWTEEVIVAKWSPNAKLTVQIIIDLKLKTIEQRSD